MKLGDTSTFGKNGTSLMVIGIGVIIWVFLSAEKEAMADDLKSGQAGERIPQSFARGDSYLGISHLLGAQYGPLGVLYEIHPKYTWRLFSSDDHLVSRGGHLAVGFVFGVSPSFVYYGPSLTIAPLSILKIEFQLNHVMLGFWKRKYGILDYDELGQFADYSFSYRQHHGDEIGHSTNKALAFLIKPTLALKLSSFVALYRGVYMYFHPGDFEGLYYNYIAGIVLSHKSWALTHELMLLIEFLNNEKSGQLVRAGLDNHLIAVMGDGTATPLVTAYQWKIGPMVAWTLAKHVANGVIEQPTLVAQIHLFGHDAIADPNRKRIFSATLAFLFNTNWYPFWSVAR